MKKVKKRLSLFLALIMVISLLPVNAFAEDVEEAVPVIQVEENAQEEEEGEESGEQTSELF